jgi:hypothetical protein
MVSGAGSIKNRLTAKKEASNESDSLPDEITAKKEASIQSDSLPDEIKM